jgi:TPR repeat protein
MSPSHFNLELGHKWLEIAANEHNDTAAMYHIGMYYWNLEEDGAREKAVEWFEKGASKGSTPAMFWLGYAHHQGEAPFTQNTQKACEYLEKGVTFNDPECLHYYGIMLRGGEQIPKDAERGFKYLVRAAEHPDTPHADAAYIVGMVYLRGDESAAVDYRKAMHFMKIAGREGHPEALNTLGAMYYSGLGTEQDYEKAFYSYQNAALYVRFVFLRDLFCSFPSSYSCWSISLFIYVFISSSSSSSSSFLNDRTTNRALKT